MGGITDFLSGFKPSMNDDGDGAVTGVAMTKVNRLYEEKNKEGVFDRYRIELETVECLDGKINVGKRFWKTYYKDSDTSAKQFANDMFTAKIELDWSSEEALKASFENAIGKPVCVRAWGWTPEKKQDGTPIPVEERVQRQQFIIKNSANLKAKGAGKGNQVPF